MFKNLVSLLFQKLNVKLLSALIMLFIVINGSPLKSQTQYCYPDCDSSLWVPDVSMPPASFFITLPCGEPVIVAYRIRYACNNYHDLFLESVFFVNGLSGGTHCGLTMTLAQMLENIMEQMIIHDPMNFPPTNTNNDTCVDNYRVLLGACWMANFVISAGTGNHPSQSDIGMDSPVGMIEPCISIRCCLQSYRVCIVNHLKVITYKPESSVSGVCDTVQGPFCKPVCQ